MTKAERPTRRRGGIAAVLSAVPLSFAIVAEAAWISVVAGLVQEFALREPALGIPALAGFVLAGVVAGRLLGSRLGRQWPVAAVVMTIAAGLAGSLVSPDARAALASGNVGGALAAHPGGWFAALAVVRGFAHARLPLSEATLGRLVAAGIPGLAVAAIVGGMIAEPWRGRFLADALVGAIIFLTSATLGLALARLTAVGADSGFDWRRNPPWFGLLVVLVVVAAAVALPAASVVAPAIGLLVGVAIVPLVVLGFVAGFGMRTLRVLAGFGFAAIALFAVLTVLGAAGPLPPIGPIFSGGTATPEAPPEVGAVGVGVLLVVAVVLILVLARLWMRRSPFEEDDIVETRTIDHGDATSAPRRPRRRRRLPIPVDAVTAYLRLVDELASRPGLRRGPAETPAEHARRLRTTGRSGLSMDLLAADYALARYGEIRLSPAEDRRAVVRWRTLRRRLVVRRR